MARAAKRLSAEVDEACEESEGHKLASRAVDELPRQLQMLHGAIGGGACFPRGDDVDEALELPVAVGVLGLVGHVVPDGLKAQGQHHEHHEHQHLHKVVLALLAVPLPASGSRRARLSRL